MTTTTPPTVDIDFAPVPGVRRALTVRVPDENQLAVWAASGERFQTLGEDWRAEEAALADLPADGPEWAEYRTRKAQQATRALARGMRLIRSALANERDADWVEDCLLDGRFRLGDALGILTGAVDQLRQHKAEKAPTNGPAKKAHRID